MRTSMGARSTYDLIDKFVYDGRLGQTLEQWRRDGDTYEQITFRLREKGVIVAVSTVCRWVGSLEQPAAS